MFIDYSNPSHVVITHRGTKLTGSISSDTDYDWWLHINVETNYYPANILNVDYSKFIKNVLGYDKGNNSVRSKEDLIKVLDALNKEYDRQFGSTEQFDSEKYLNPEDLKDGDYLYIENPGFKGIYIFKEYKDGKVYRHIFYDIILHSVYVNSGYATYTYSNTKIRKATSNEIQTLDNALLVQKGLFWNPESKQLEKLGVVYFDTTKTIDSPIVAASNEISFSEPTSMREPPKVVYSSKDQTISINNFIKPKKHYKLNFNN